MCQSFSIICTHIDSDFKYPRRNLASKSYNRCFNPNSNSKQFRPRCGIYKNIYLPGNLKGLNLIDCKNIK